MNEGSRLKIAVFSAVLVIFAVASVWFGPRMLSAYYFKQGEKAFLSRNFEEAMNHLKRSSSWYPQDPYSHALLGGSFTRYAKQKGDVYGGEARSLYRESLVQFEAAKELGLNERNYSRYGEYLNDYGVALWRLKEYDRAVEVFKEKAEKFPDSSFLARYMIAVDYIERQNMPQQALDILSPAFSSSDVIPDLLPEAYSIMLRVSTYFENEEGVEKWANLILNSSQPDDVKSKQFVYVHLATLASRIGDLDRAVKFLDQADEAIGEQGRHACILANYYADNKKYDVAIKQGKMRDEPRCWSALSRVYFSQGQKQLAKEFAEKTLAKLKSLERKDIFAHQGISQMEKILSNL